MKAAHDTYSASEGMTTIHYAACAGELRIVSCLLERAADPLLPDAHGRSAAYLAEKYPDVRKRLYDAMQSYVRADETLCYPDPHLGLAASKGDAGRVKRLLADRADPDSLFNGATALQLACLAPPASKGGQHEVAAALLEVRSITPLPPHIAIPPHHPTAIRPNRSPLCLKTMS
jgi:ankyrin repeat protein